jgi:NAD(P)-dependent dehydrogenase (short-subunit alcohol dehydrogenase family)
MSGDERRTALIVGASRAIGLALAAEFLKRGWDVIATVRGTQRTPLRAISPTRQGIDSRSKPST